MGRAHSVVPNRARKSPQLLCTLGIVTPKTKTTASLSTSPATSRKKSFQRRKSWLTESLQNNLCLVIVYFLDVSSKSCVEGLEPKVGSKTFRRWGLIGKSCVPEDIPLKGKLRPWNAYLLSLFSSLPQPRPLSPWDKQALSIKYFCQDVLPPHRYKSSWARKPWLRLWAEIVFLVTNRRFQAFCHNNKMLNTTAITVTIFLSVPA